MAVTVTENGRLFTIHTANSTYQMKADKYGVLLHLYYGRRSGGSMEYLLTYADRGFASNIYDCGRDRTYSLDLLPQEFPVSGTGDMRSTALTVEYGNGTNGCDLRFSGYRILDGKYSLKGLPAVYAEKNAAQTLEITLEDTAGLVEVTLLYGVLPELDIITRSALIRNTSGAELRLEKVMSANLDFVSGDFDLITFYGRHCLERNFQRTPVAHMEQWIGSRRGMSSHHYNPMMILAGRDTTETRPDAGEILLSPCARRILHSSRSDHELFRRRTRKALQQPAGVHPQAYLPRKVERPGPPCAYQQLGSFLYGF